MSLHLNGLGFLGSSLAWFLEEAGVEFTWDDPEVSVNAWRASTGCIYPAGREGGGDLWNQRTFAGYQGWRKWVERPEWKDHVETAAFWFSQKNPPNGADYPISARVGPLSKASLPSYHINAQTFVPATRERFSSQRLSGAPSDPSVRKVVSHGFGPRLDRYLWGWTVLCKLDYSEEIRRECNGLRPCFFLNIGRLIRYAYPVPGTPYWYCGPGMVPQKVAREYGEDRIMKSYLKWEENLAQTTGGAVWVSEVGPILQGWRPASNKTDDDLVMEKVDGSLVFPSLYHSGLRWAPLLVDDILGGGREERPFPLFRDPPPEDPTVLDTFSEVGGGVLQFFR